MTSNTDLRVSPEAEHNVDEILSYTFRTWGNGQAVAYFTHLWNAFQRIQAFPEIGRRVSDEQPEIREHILEHHTIVYRYEANVVTILRIVNPRRRGR